MKNFELGIAMVLLYKILCNEFDDKAGKSNEMGFVLTQRNAKRTKQDNGENEHVEFRIIESMPESCRECLIM